jgi:hypothetical protein
VIFKFGDYVHAANEVDVTMLTQQRMYSPRNFMVFLRKTLTIQGHICKSGTSAITAAIKALEAGYLKEIHSVGLWEDDGTTRTAHVLLSGTSAGCLNGIRLLTLDYPKADGGEYATGRTFRAVFQADYITDEGRDLIESQLYAWEETLTVVGAGGMDWELIPQFMGPPVFQVNCQITPQRVIQSGQSVGVLAHIAPPMPYWPANTHDNRTLVQYGTAQKVGHFGQHILYPVKWMYHMSFVPGSGCPVTGGSIPNIPSGLPYTPDNPY